MLNFKKKGIFTRQAPKEDALPQQEPQDGILAVWGSPGSGKTTVAVKIAKYLADRKKNVVLLLCDMTAPMLPCICLLYTSIPRPAGARPACHGRNVGGSR